MNFKEGVFKPMQNSPGLTIKSQSSLEEISSGEKVGGNITLKICS